MPLRVFISYPTRDGVDKAKQAAHLLKKAGHEAWIWYHSKTVGALTWREIAKCIVYDSDAVLYICTHCSQMSWGQGQEAGYALNHRRKMIVVAVDDASVPVELTARCYERSPSDQFCEKLARIAANLTEITNRIQKLDDVIVPGFIRGI